MLIGAPKESRSDEPRVALVPAAAEKLVKLGADVRVESGLGPALGFDDAAYEKVGASVAGTHDALLREADLVLRLRQPAPEEIQLLKQGAVHISYLDPFNHLDLVQAFAEKQISAFSMEMVPRTTRAQKLDALSSQASLAGYVGMILAAEKLNKVFPMMMTPAGTISPSRVFVIGAGVAGLQAIATAKRLGARVEAFDTRPAVAEQVESLGAKFVKIDLGDTGETEGGYARELTPEQVQKQKEGQAKVIAQSDVVITTAKVFGRKPPQIVSTAMVEAMRPGSVVVDMAAEDGGNVECSQPDQVVEHNGVHVIGLGNLPGRVAVHASQMYASNLASFVDEFWDQEAGAFRFTLEDEIVAGCLITHEGKIVNQRIRDHHKLDEGGSE